MAFALRQPAARTASRADRRTPTFRGAAEPRWLWVPGCATPYTDLIGRRTFTRSGGTLDAHDPRLGEAFNTGGSGYAILSDANASSELQGFSYTTRFRLTRTGAIQGLVGTLNTGSTEAFYIAADASQTSTYLADSIQVFVRSNNNLVLQAAVASSLPLNGQWRTLTARISVNTVDVWIDGVKQTTTYEKQQSPSIFNPFSFPFWLGGVNSRGSMLWQSTAAFSLAYFDNSGSVSDEQCQRLHRQLDRLLLRRSRVVAFTPAAGDTELTVASATHAHSADNATFAVQHILAIADALHGHAVDQATLAQVHSLLIGDATHGHVADNVDLSGTQALIIANALHGHAAAAASFIQQHLLTVADAAHAHSADNATLIQQHLLAIGDALHSHAADSAGIIQQHLLAVLDATHGHAADNVTVTTGLVLDIANGIHAHAADSLTLTQAHVLAIENAAHSHSADSVSFSLNFIIAPADATHGHAADNVTLDASLTLAIQDAVHAVTDAGITLAQQHTLIVSDALHAHVAGLVSLFPEVIGTPDSRVFVVVAENRTYIVSASE